MEVWGMVPSISLVLVVAPWYESVGTSCDPESSHGKTRSQRVGRVLALFMTAPVS